MPKRKVTELDRGLEAPRRASRRISTSNDPPETASKAAPNPKKSKKTEKNKKVQKTGVNSKQEEDSEAVSFFF
jgi:hypothetical protein